MTWGGVRLFLWAEFSRDAVLYSITFLWRAFAALCDSAVQKK